MSERADECRSAGAAALSARRDPARPPALWEARPGPAAQNLGEGARKFLRDEVRQYRPHRRAEVERGSARGPGRARRCARAADAPDRRAAGCAPRSPRAMAREPLPPGVVGPLGNAEASLDLIRRQPELVGGGENLGALSWIDASRWPFACHGRSVCANCPDWPAEQFASPAGSRAGLTHDERARTLEPRCGRIIPFSRQFSSPRSSSRPALPSRSRLSRRAGPVASRRPRLPAAVTAPAAVARRPRGKRARGRPAPARSRPSRQRASAARCRPA